MGEARQALSAELLKARQELTEAQHHVADLEAALLELAELPEVLDEQSLDTGPLRDNVRDLPPHQNSEALIRQLYRTLGVLSDINQAIVRIRHLPTLFEHACRIAVERGAFRMAMIALFDPHSRRLNPVASAGFVDNYLEKLNIVLADDNPHGHGPTATAIRTGKRVIINDIDTDPRMYPWRADALRLGYRSLAVLPLTVPDVGQGILYLYAPEPDFFNPEEIKLIEEMAMDIAFAMAFADQEQQRQAAEATVQQSFKQLAILRQIDVGIMQATSTQAVIEAALQRIRQLIPCERVAVIWFDWTSNDWLTFADADDQPYVSSHETRSTLPPGWTEDFATIESRVFNDLRLLENPLPMYQQFIAAGLLAGLQVRLMDRGRVIGLLSLHASATGFFTPEYEQLVGQIASQLAIAIQDITERNAQERQLRYQASVQENVSDAVIVTDMDYIIQSWNPAAERIYGWRADEALGQKLIPFLHSEFIEPGERERESELLRKQGWWQGEISRHDKYGNLLYVRRSIAYVKDKDGQPFGIVSISYDITARKRAENDLAEERNRLRTIIDTIPDSIYVKDTNHRFVLCNQAIATTHGYQKPDEMISKDDFDHFPTTLAEHFRAREIEIMRTGQPMIDEEELLDLPGKTAWASSNKFPLRNLQGEVIGLIGTTRDITERKQSEILMQQALAKEKELNELKSRFVSMASHEFRTPLASILAATETLKAYRQRMADPQIERRLANIKDQVEHLKSIMDDMLYLARLEARRSDFNPVSVNPDMLCRSIIDEFQERPDIHREIRYTSGDPLREISLDIKLMRQIISNLVSNAIKYSPQDQIITISLDYTATALILRFSDLGIGIPEADLKHLFEPFHRATNVGTISGTGLGLVITKESVDRHGGIITVDSQVDRGTTFTVTIPIATQEGTAT